MQMYRKLLHPPFRFSFFMWLVALHSFIAGVGLIFSPPDLFTSLGYNFVTERFFTIQGGVFHVVMCVGYLMAAFRKEKYEGVIYLSIIAKFFATIFLITYSVLIDWVWVVFLSGIFDFFIGVTIILFYKQYRENLTAEDT